MRNNEKNNDEIEIVNEVEVIDAVNEVVVMKKFFTPIKIGISIAIILVITIVGGISYNKYSIAKAEKVKIANEELYMEKLKLVTYSIIEQGVVIEAMTQEISTI